MKKGVVGDYLFQIHGISDFAVRTVGGGGEDADSIDFVIHFRPRLSRPLVSPVHVNIFHTPSNRHVFGQTISGEDGKVLVYREEELEYEEYETYQLKVSNKRRTIESMYVTLEDGQTKVNMKLVFLSRLLAEGRAHFLDWFPPDVDPKLYALRIDPRRIPQRCPLWFKLRGELTGSKSYTLLGFFVPPKPTPYVFGAPMVVDAAAKARMRLGSQSEDYIMLMYLYVREQCIFHEIGWCPMPSPPAYPMGWGASPDALFIDPDMTWESVPADVASHYSDEERAKIDITRSAGEFKTTSTSNLAMRAYYYSQCYVEMISLNVVWCDLVQFRRVKMMHGNRIVYDNCARVYRIFRHKPTEILLVKLWRYALSNRDRLQDVVMEPPFVKMRLYFEQMAQQHAPISIPIGMNPDLELAYAQYDSYKKEKGRANNNNKKE